jgi:hypothetical protein
VGVAGGRVSLGVEPAVSAGAGVRVGVGGGVSVASARVGVAGWVDVGWTEGVTRSGASVAVAPATGPNGADGEGSPPRHPANQAATALRPSCTKFRRDNVTVVRLSSVAFCVSCVSWCSKTWSFLG